jgi:hypothetical protein
MCLQCVVVHVKSEKVHLAIVVTFSMYAPVS